MLKLSLKKRNATRPSERATVKRKSSCQVNTMVKATVIVPKLPYDGIPTESGFDIIEEDLPPIQNGEFLCEAEYVSVDPYLRLEAHIPASQVARVVESKNSKFPVGSYVVGYIGWRTHTIISDPVAANLKPLPPQIRDLPKSYGLSVLGMPGMTAYFGFLEYCQPKPGETVVVSTAAGAVGSLVGQIAKIKGCKVIGYTGSDEKVKWVQELGFDHVFNYRKVDLEESLKSSAPEGVDCYFDNVGGEFASTVINHMRDNGRVTVCGSISLYNEDEENPTKVTHFHKALILKQLTIHGFMVYRFRQRYPEGLTEMAKWIREGKIKFKETITEGFKNTPKAFISMFHGENIGKAVVKVK